MNEIQAFGFRDGTAETVFTDGVSLRVLPVSMEDPVAIRRCVLIDDGQTVAAVSDDRFWSSSSSQAEFAARLGAAVEAERKVYRAYRSGKIDESMWLERFRSFWKVMIRCREIFGKASVGALAECGSQEEV